VIEAPAGSPPALDRSWFDRPALDVAHDLLDLRLVHHGADGTVGGRIVEVEAYAGPEDLAAHSAGGRRTARTEVMFGPPGHLYVYLVYGLHHCLNVVAGPGLKPEAVLIRSLIIDEGIDVARARRGGRVADVRLASGPGNVGAALGVDRRLSGADLLGGPVRLEPDRSVVGAVRAGPRIGVGYAGAWAAEPMRLWIEGDPHVSRR
jgi:DNA-3-methyladenine glycosylase